MRTNLSYETLLATLAALGTSAAAAACGGATVSAREVSAPAHHGGYAQQACSANGCGAAAPTKAAAPADAPAMTEAAARASTQPAPPRMWATLATAFGAGTTSTASNVPLPEVRIETAAMPAGAAAPPPATTPPAPPAATPPPPPPPVKVASKPRPAPAPAAPAPRPKPKAADQAACGQGTCATPNP